jgi:Secretion system C-terminal sorting domain
MKTLTARIRKVLFLMFLIGSMGLVLNQNTTNAQAPDCASGTVMYALFNDSTGSGTNAPSEIRSVNYTTGAVGPLMGGTSYLIQKTSGSTFYGSAGMGLDALTLRFYVMTQMSSGTGIRKDIISINTNTATMVVIGTTPSSLNDFHFVKVAISPAGVGYAIGVHRDTTDAAFIPARCHPVLRFTTCGATPTPGCSVMTLLGYLPYTGNHYHQFNGDIAFDNTGNLYFAAAGFQRISGSGRYTDARLYRIAAANIPLVAGTGTIPMSLLADYNSLDSTVLNGITFSPPGSMYFSTRRFPAGQNPPALSVNEIYRSFTLGSATVLSGFSVPTPGYSVADLGGCYFPNSVLAQNQLTLSSSFMSGIVNLRWQVNNNSQALYYEVERSDDETNFETIARIDIRNPDQGSEVYTSSDVQKGASKSKFYRIRQVMQNGIRFYSNVVKVNLNAKITLIGRPNPNPFTNKFAFNANLRSDNNIHVTLSDQNGRKVYQKIFNGRTGSNALAVENLSNLKPGIYLVEIKVEDETIHEKLIKQ